MAQRVKKFVIPPYCQVHHFEKQGINLNLDSKIGKSDDKTRALVLPF